MTLTGPALLNPLNRKAYWPLSLVLSEPVVAVVPMPVRLTMLWFPPSPSITSKATRSPAAVGVKVTVNVQLVPAAIADGQLFVCAKSAKLAPLIATLPTDPAATPALVSVTVLGALVVLTVWLPKASEARFKKNDAVLTTVTAAVADLVESAADLAATTTVGGLGTVAGAVYFPVGSIVPQLAPEQPDPEILQVTAWLAPLGLTVVMNCCTLPA